MATGPCPQCGAQVERDMHEFCPDCGYYLTWTDEPAQDEPDAVMTRRPGERDDPPPPPAAEQSTAPIPVPEPEPEAEPPPPPPAPRRTVPVWAAAAGGVVAVALVVLVAVLLWDPEPPGEEVAAGETEVADTSEPEPEPEVLDTPDVEAVRLASPPSVDGDLGDWEGVHVSYLSTHQVHPEFRRWDDHDDFRVTWKLGWDDDFLYLAGSVEDDVHVQNQTGDQIWRGNSLDLHLNTAFGEAHDLADRVNEQHFQLILSPGDFSGLEPSAALLRGAPGGSTHFQTVDHGRLFDLAAQPLSAEGGFTLEVAVPWSLFGVEPRAGLVLGAALNASDNDRPGEAVQEVMVSNAPERRLASPATWGTLTLASGD